MSRKTRKLIWSAPLMAFLAVAGALALFVALAPNGVQAHDVPGVVTDLNAQAAPDDPTTPEVEGRTQIKLMWKAPTGTGMQITGYRIDRSEDGHVWDELVADSGTPGVLEHTDTVKGSKTGSTYFYRVLAINSSGTGPMSVIDDGTTKPLEAPDRPESVSAEANGPTEIVVKWTAPADDGGSPITKYRIHIDLPGTANNNDFPDVTMAVDDVNANGRIVEGDVCEFSSNGNTFEYRHKGRLEQQTFRYQVYAINDVGTSAGSAIRGDTTDEKEQPDNPTDVLAVQVNNTTVQLYWNWPESNGGAEITGFRVEVTERSGQWPDSDSAAPDAVGATTSDPDLSIGDDTPDNAADDVFNGAFTVLAVGSSANAHEVTHTHGFNTTDGTPTGVGKTLYYRVFTVTGSDADGVSRSPSSVSVRLVGDGDDDGTDIDLPPALDADTVTAAPPTMADDPHGSYSKLTLNWAPPSDSPTSYRIDYSKDGIQWKRLERDTTLTRPGEYNDDELDPETDRHYRVFAKRGGQFRPAAKSAEAMTLAAIAPDNVKVTATPLAPDKVQVRWDQPDRDGGADVTHYQVQVSDDGQGGWSVAKWITVEKDPATCTPEPVGEWEHTGLLAETTRYYRVFAVNSVNMPQTTPAMTLVAVPADGAQPDADPATTPMASRPQAPIGLTAELAKDSRLKAAGKQGVLLVWNAPPKPPGSPVNSYRIERKVMGEDNDEWMEQEAANTASETHYTDRDEPVSGEMRYYRVAATNRLTDDSEGVSDWSNVISIPIADHTHPPGTVDDASGLTTAPGTAAGTAELTWTEGDNANVHWVFGIAVNDDGSLDFTDRVWMQARAESPYMVTGLTSGKMYTFAIISGHYDASLTPNTRWSEWTWAAADVTVN